LKGAECGAGDSSAIPIALLGSGAFAVNSFELLRQRSDELGVRIVCVVSQPDRKAGRGQESQPTPVSSWAIAHGLELVRRADVNDAEAVEVIRRSGAALFVVIAFGQKISSELLRDIAAINLHGSLLPAWRGAAPIQRSVMAGDPVVGVSVIGVGERMDAGLVFATGQTASIPAETAGELHDRLAHLGATALLETIAKWVKAFRGESPSIQRAQRALDAIGGTAQDESLVTRAKKLSRMDAWVDFTRGADEVSARINGLSPWPGVDAVIGGVPIRLLRARVAARDATVPTGAQTAKPGDIQLDGFVACGSGAIELLEVQAPGSRVIALAAFLNGRRLGAGARIESTIPNSIVQGKS